MTHQLNPARLAIRPGLVCVKLYERPEATAGGIILPEDARTDKSWSLFEVVKAGPPDENDPEDLGVDLDLREGDIVTTRMAPGVVDSGCDDETDGRRLLFIKNGAILKVTRWKEE